MPGKRPDFLGIGAAKCGTTTLARHLRDHPDVRFPKCGRKELHFFDEAEITPETVGSYRDEFDSERVSGEFTPAYIFDPKCPGLVERALGTDLKLIAILRDPVDRAWSHYWHAVKEWHKPEYRPRGYPVEDLSFEDAIEAEPARLASGEFHIRHQSYFSKGLYDEQLDRWFALFDRTKFLVVLNDDLVADPLATLNHIASFLGVRPFEPFESEVRLNSMSEGSVPLETRAKLIEQYRPSIERLESMLDRDLSAWKRVDRTGAVA